MDSVTIAGRRDDIITVGGSSNPADRFFNFTNPKNDIYVSENNQPYELEDIIKQEIDGTKGILDKIKANAGDTKLSDKQLVDMYNTTFGDSGMLIF